MYTRKLPYTRKLLLLAWPLLGSFVMQMAYNFFDMMWVGQLGDAAVTSVGTGGMLSNMQWAFAAVIATGGSILISQAIGAKDKARQQELKSTGLTSILLFSVLVGVISYTFAYELIELFALQASETIKDAVAYTRVAAWSLPVTYFNLFAVGVFNAYGKTKLSFKILLVGTLANILLDPLFIFVFDLEVLGAAYATVIARCLVACLCIYAFRKHILMSLVWVRPHVRTCLDIVQVGMPISIQRVMMGLISIAIARIISDWGDHAIAVQRVGVQLEALTYMLAGGLMQATTILVGQSYGAQKYDRLPKIYYSALRIAVLIGLVNTFLFWFFPKPLYDIFFDEPEIIAMGVNYMKILAFSQAFMCIEMITGGLFYGLGKSRTPGVISTVFNLLRIPSALYLGHELMWGLDGVWWSISMSSVFKAITALIAVFILFNYQKHTVWIKQAKS